MDIDAISSFELIEDFADFFGADRCWLGTGMPCGETTIGMRRSVSHA
ncbi:hypothetical protein ACQPZ2_04230 [Nocardia pseudovaccinii]